MTRLLLVIPLVALTAWLYRAPTTIPQPPHRGL